MVGLPYTVGTPTPKNDLSGLAANLPLWQLAAHSGPSNSEHGQGRSPS